MPPFVSIVTNTPAPVFVILAYLIWEGIRSLRPRSRSIWRLLTTPILFIIIGLSRVLFDPSDGAWALASWAAAAALLFVLAFLTGPRQLTVDRRSREVAVPGSPLPLIRNVVVFILQYAVALTTAAEPAQHNVMVIVGHAVSGATAGYFLGWATVLVRHYREAISTAGGNKAAKAKLMRRAGR